MINQIFAKRGVLLISLIVVLLSTSSIAQEYTLPYIIKDIALCDMDLDGNNDIIISIWSTDTIPDTVYFYYGIGEGNFSLDAIQRENGLFIFCKDIDGDSLRDIITRDANNILSIKNYGARTYGPEVALYPATNHNMQIKYVADMNNDGLNDLGYTSGNNTAYWGILKNNDSLNFENINLFDGGIGPVPTQFIGYMNGDDLLDINTTFPEIGTYALLNQGNFNFSSRELDTLPIQYKPILNIDTVFPQDVMLFRGQSEEIRLLDNFQLRDSLFLENAVRLEDINDYNQDGFDDYCYTRCWFGYCTDSIYIRINNQDWGFYHNQHYYVDPMWTMFFVRSADLNGDNYPDLVLSGYNDRRQFKILWNDGTGSFSYINPVAISEQTSLTSSINISVFPNPFRNSINIEIKIKDLSYLQNSGQVEILDFMGKSIITYPISFNQNDEKTVVAWDGHSSKGSISAPGIYFVKFHLQGFGCRTLKVIKL
jgi:hypothetical protein